MDMGHYFPDLTATSAHYRGAPIAPEIGIKRWIAGHWHGSSGTQVTLVGVDIDEESRPVGPRPS